MGSFSKCADSNFKIPDPGDPNQAHFLISIFNTVTMHEEKRPCLRNLFSLYTYRTTMICPLKLVTTCIPHRTSGALDTLLELFNS